MGLLIGEHLFETYGGPFIDKGVETYVVPFINKSVDTTINSIDNIINPESLGYVILDQDNPLHGTFSKTIKFDITDPRTQEHRVVELNPATFDWHPETSTWQLDSKSKEELRKKFDDWKARTIVDGD